jgi:hypothetical protein
MLRNSNPPRLKTAVKLFPRLATARAALRPGRLGSPVVGRAFVAATANPREMEALRVRTRLLRMIVDNENARRNGWRPNAS